MLYFYEWIRCNETVLCLLVYVPNMSGLLCELFKHGHVQGQRVSLSASHDGWFSGDLC